eukprot:gene14785-19870_t
MPPSESFHSVLFVCTSISSSSWMTSTGIWLDELAVPYYIFKDAGYDISICSIKGGEPAIDPGSINPDFITETSKKFLASPAVSNIFDNSMPSLKDKLNCDNFKSYCCIFLVGGHGCVDDFPNNDDIKQAVEYLYNTTKGCVAAICHGSLGLLNCKSNGKALLADKFVAVFSNEEEQCLGLQNTLPIFVENKVDEIGAICVPAAP